MSNARLDALARERDIARRDYEEARQTHEEAAKRLEQATKRRREARWALEKYVDEYIPGDADRLDRFESELRSRLEETMSHAPD